MRKSALLFAALVLPTLAGAQEWRGPAAIAVSVEDAKGKNLAGAEILLVYLSPDGGGGLPSVLTDGGGRANIGGLAAGRWSVEVRHAGHMSYLAELAISADGKPVVLSASHQMAPGATSTMKVKFSRGRGGAAHVPAPSPPPPPLVADEPPARAPAPLAAPAPVAPEPAAIPAPAVARAPVKEAAPGPRVAPAPAVARAPVKDSAPAAPVALAPAPVVTPAVEKAPVKEAASAAPVVPAPVSAPAMAMAPVEDAPPAAPGTPAPARVPAPAVERSPVEETAPAGPVVPAPAPAPSRARLCVECPPGESAAWGEATIEGGAAVGCPADLAARLRSVELSAVAELSRELAAEGVGCRVIAIELPAGARFTGFRYEAQSAGLAADCLPGRGCPAGGCRFPNEPVLRQDGQRTVLLVAFESTDPELRRAVVAGYSTYNKR